MKITIRKSEMSERTYCMPCNVYICDMIRVPNLKFKPLARMMRVNQR